MTTLQDELGFRFASPNRVQRWMQVLPSTRPGAWVFSKVLPPLDRILHRVSRGRLTLPGLLTGLPVVMITTTGARSGLPRTTPLVGVPVGDGALALVGTNFGQRPTPGWVHNLTAWPEATVSWRDRTVTATARPARDDERQVVLERAGAMYHGYDLYQERIHNRPIAIFVLEPATTL